MGNGKSAGRLSANETEIKVSIDRKIHARAANFVYGAFSPSADLLFLAHEDNNVLFFSLPNFTQQSKFTLLEHPRVSFFDISLDSRLFFAGGDFDHIILFDLKESTERPSFSLPKGCFSLAKMKIIGRNSLSFLGENRVFYVINYESQQIILSFTLDFSKIISEYDVSANSRISLFLTTTGEVLIYDLQSLIADSLRSEEKYRENGHPEDLVSRKIETNLDFSPKKQPQKTSDKFFSNPVTMRTDRNHTLKKSKQSKPSGKHIKSSQQQTQPLNFSELTPQNLRSFLVDFKRFPSKNRGTIWKVLLSLPNNSSKFTELANKPMHPAIANLQNNFPIEDQGLFKNLQKILSTLSYHCTLFSEVDFFPALIFPFVKILPGQDVLGFEVILSFLMNWARDFFMDFPNPPIVFLENIEELIKFHEFEVYRHFSELNVDILSLIWGVFKANYTGILGKEDWLVFMDHLFANSNMIGLYSLFIVGYFSYFRNTLLKISEMNELNIFTNTHNAIDIEKILKHTIKLYKSTPRELIERISPFFNALSSPDYPPFTFYPQISLDFHHKIREKIANEEKELKSRKKALSQLSFLSEELIEREKRYRKRQENMIRLENERRERLLQEENAKLMEKIEEERRFRTKRIEQLKVLESTISSSMRNQEHLREEELAFLQRELDSRKMLEEHLLESKMEEEALLGLEFTMSQKINEIIGLRNREERQRKIRQELDFKAKQEGFATRLMEERWKNEDLESNLRRELQKQQKLAELNEMEERNDDENLRYTLMLEAYQKDLKFLELEKERKLRQLAEEDTLRNEKLLETIKTQEELTRKEDEKHLRMILNNEKQSLIEKSREILDRMRETNKRHEEEVEEHRRKLREIANVQKRTEFEQKVYEIKKENDLRMIEEEKKLHRLMMSLEEGERARRELKDDIENKEQECRERDKFYQSLKENQERLIQDKRVKYDEYRSSYKQEMERLRKMNENVSLEKLNEYKERNTSSDFRTSLDPKESLYSYGNSSRKFSEEKAKRPAKERKDEILIQDNPSEKKANDTSGEFKYEVPKYQEEEESLKQSGDSEAKYEFLEKHDEVHHSDKMIGDKKYKKSYESPSYGNDNHDPLVGRFAKNKGPFRKEERRDEEIKEELMYSPDTDEKKEGGFAKKYDYDMDFEELDEEQNESSSAENQERQRRKVDTEIDQPKYRSHSNTPDRYEVLDEEAEVFD